MSWIKIVYVILSMKFTIQYELEMECNPGKKTCIQELFKGGEPLSVEAIVSESPSTRFSIYLTLENDQRQVLNHVKYNLETENTLLTYNNPKNQPLRICIDNFETFAITVKLNIKYDHKLGNLESLPTVFEYSEIDQKLNEVIRRMQNSYTYFEQNEEASEDIQKSGGTYNIIMVIVSILTITTTILTGLGVLYVMKQEIKKKKNW